MMTASAAQRIDWVDCAKGICIILVVMMHSTLGVEKAFGEAGALTHFIAWARPFRMPDFFLISGLFLARRMAAPWPKYADTKIVHFAYFYVLWMTIQFLFRGYGIYADAGVSGVLREYMLGFIEPFGTLWFIYLLAVFFAVTKLAERVPAPVIFALAAILEMLPIETGWTLIDEFAARYVYFFAGYWLAQRVFGFAGRIGAFHPAAVLAGLAVWAFGNGILVFTGMSQVPGIGLALGFIGAAAVIAFAVVISDTRGAGVLRYLGANSIVVYLAFFVFMAGTRTVLIRFAPWLGSDVISIAVTTAGVVGPVLLHLMVKNTRFKFLFVRPLIAKVETWRKGWHSGNHDPSPASAKELSETQIR
jgi:uncharacterized membrane protein YcfT